jgi:hydroxymethylbilane synthase
MLPCVGQGVVAIQTRKGSSHGEVAKLNNHWNTYYSVMAERAMLQEIDGDCHTAVGAISTLVGDCINLKAINYNTGKQFESTSKLLEYKLLGEEVGKQLK